MFRGTPLSTNLNKNYPLSLVLVWFVGIIVFRVSSFYLRALTSTWRKQISEPTSGNPKQKRRVHCTFIFKIIPYLILFKWRKEIAQIQRLVNLFSPNSPKMDGKKKQEKENLRTRRWRKEKKDDHLKLSTMPRTILFCKNYKKKI